MTQAQPYSLHKMPAVMGLTSFEFKDFLDMLIMANDEQLEAMKKAIVQEIEKRDKNEM